MSALKLEKLNISYGDKKVINDVSLDVHEGEIFGLIGLNGAGKTTIIKTVLGLRDSDTGDVSVLDLPRGSPKAKKSLAYLPEKFEPPWFLTGMEFLKFSLTLYDQPFDKDQMIDAAKSLSLDTDALKRRMHTYSKGMRQKLGLMGTLLTGGHLFILDEPMSGLDPKARALVKKMILTMKKDHQTIFLCSHILADMDEICDRVAVLNNGKIEFVGPPKDLKSMTNTDNLEKAFLDFIESAEVV